VSEFQATPGGGLVTLAGEIDLTTILDVRKALEAAAVAGEGVVVVEMSGVTFIDSSGLNELVRPTHDGHVVIIRGATSFARHLFEITGLDVVLKVED
jgi:anti-sigma B factor antagonist